MQNTIHESFVSRRRTLGVNRGQTVVMSGSHQLPQCAGVAGGNFTADNRVGRKTNHQVNNFGIVKLVGLFGTRHHDMCPVGMRYQQFARIFDRDNPFMNIQNLQQIVQKGGLTGRSRTADQNMITAFNT